MKVFSPRGWAIALAAIALTLSAQPAKANFTISVTDGTHSASAEFQQVAPGGAVTIILTNTATYDAMVPTDILTGLFFNYTGSNPAVLPNASNSAFITAGSTFVLNGSVSPPGGNVGGEWALASNTAVAEYGISSAGLGDFGDGNFNGPELQGPPNSGAVDGIQWGITTATDNFATGNGALQNNALTKNSVTFTLIVPSGFDIANISSTRFQYGTDYTEGHLDGGGGGGGNAVPAPAGLILLASAVPVFAFRRLIRRKPAAA
jgi:hypothetical protein